MSKRVGLGFLLVGCTVGCAAGSPYFHTDSGTAPVNRADVAVLRVQSLFLRQFRLAAIDDTPVPGNANIIIVSPGKHKLHFNTPSGSTQKYLLAEAGNTYLASVQISILLNPSNWVTIRDVTETPASHHAELPPSPTR